MTRNIYREKFGLTSGEMDDEPMDEAAIHGVIWGLQDKQQAREAKRVEQSNPRGGQ